MVYWVPIWGGLDEGNSFCGRFLRREHQPDWHDVGSPWCPWILAGLLHAVSLSVTSPPIPLCEWQMVRPATRILTIDRLAAVGVSVFGSSCTHAYRLIHDCSARSALFA